MRSPLDTVGGLLGLAGAVACVVAGATRISGVYYLFGFEAMTLFNAGIALMVGGCLAKLHAR